MFKVVKIKKNFISNESGQVIVIFALLIVALMGMMALVIDEGSVYEVRRHLQTVADSAALAGAHELPESPDNAVQKAIEYAAINGVTITADNVEIESQNITYTKIFDSQGDALSVKNCKVESTDIIQKDQILTNDDVISTFKVGNMGGIRYTRENDVIVLLSTHSDDYDDSIDTDSGLIIYTGEGKDNQEMKNGNEKILNSQNTPMVFFKEVYQEPGSRPRGALDNKYKFVGIVKYQKHFWKEEKGRQVVKFVLEIQS